MKKLFSLFAIIGLLSAGTVYAQNAGNNKAADNESFPATHMEQLRSAILE